MQTFERLTLQRAVSDVQIETCPSILDWIRADMGAQAVEYGFGFLLTEWVTPWPHSRLTHITRLYAAREGAD